jgi:hypothetical protein
MSGYGSGLYGVGLYSSSGYAYSVLINGSFVQCLPGTLQATLAVAKMSSLQVQVRTDRNTFFAQFQQIAVYDGNSNLVFSGYLTAPQAIPSVSQQSLKWTLKAIGQEFLAKKRVYAAIWANKTCGFIVQDIYNNILSAEGVTIGNIYDGLTPNTTLYPSLTLYPGGNVGLVPQATFYYCKASDALDALVKEASNSGIPYYWAINNVTKALYFEPYGTTVGPAIDDTLMDVIKNPPTITFSNPNYRNTQYVVGGVAQTSQMTETRQGDGKTRAFTFSYGLSAAPSAFTINGTTKTIGVKGTSGSNYYYAQGDPVITQDTSQTILTSSDTMSMTYIGQFPNTAIVSDQSQISYQKGIDGTTGIIEEVVNDPSLTSAASSISEGSNLLTRFATQGIQFQFYTRQTGFAPGQLCPANMPYIGINNQQMLITSVLITDQVDQFNIWFHVTAIVGPYDTTWSDFFSSLLKQPPPANQINVGSSSQTSILQQFTASLSLMAVLNTTVLTSLFPSTSLHPSLTLYPAG